MDATAAHLGLPIKTGKPLATISGLGRAGANLTIAAMFFVSAIPAVANYKSGIANDVWIVGAAIMGILSLVRLPPRSATISIGAVAATAGMLVLPCLMRPADRSNGILALCGIAIELIGVVLTQVARIYMGRRFGLLPANRGIVSKGPFALVRHPIYIGWLLLAAGYAMSYPSARNILLIVAVLPFMIWRIEQEELLLGEDPEYSAYRARVRFRLIPGLI